jgi:hypothetical protein
MEHVNNLVVEGLNRQGIWLNIWEIDSGIHKGWNSKDFDDTEVK